MNDKASTTIFALASGTLPSAIAVMRLTGSASDEILTALAGTLPAPRRAVVRTLRYGGEILDRAVVLRFVGPHTYTGEDSAELHLHGGVAVAQAVADALLALGARPAQPGEFTRRACLAGRVGLIEAEAVADLVSAETGSQRRQALDQLGGRLTAQYEGWAARLRAMLAQQEALIDFPDEDLPAETERAALAAMHALRQDMRAHLADGQRSERIRTGVCVVISGPPNSGKSSLLNALSGEDSAIVSPLAGTTRDAVAVRSQLGGVLVTFVDTAGLHETDDPVESEGIHRARQRAADADLVLSLAGPDQVPIDVATTAERWLVRTKADLMDQHRTNGDLQISTVSGEGMEALRTRLTETVLRLTTGGTGAALTRVRHRVGIEDASEYLGQAIGHDWPELRGEALRLAMGALGEVTGQIGVEDVLDTIFGQFCIGK